jgi:hypothetical protein
MRDLKNEILPGKANLPGKNREKATRTDLIEAITER